MLSIIDFVISYSSYKKSEEKSSWTLATTFLSWILLYPRFSLLSHLFCLFCWLQKSFWWWLPRSLFVSGLSALLKHWRPIGAFLMTPILHGSHRLHCTGIVDILKGFTDTEFTWSLFFNCNFLESAECSNFLIDVFNPFFGLIRCLGFELEFKVIELNNKNIVFFRMKNAFFDIM